MNLIRSLFKKSKNELAFSDKLWFESSLDQANRMLRTLQDSLQTKNRLRAAYLGDNTAICQTIYGKKIFVDTKDISLAPHLLIEGNWESWITDAMLRVVKPEMNCIDLGANFGWYTLIMADNIGPRGSLISVDANPRMVDLLRKTISVNGFLDRCKVIQLAVTDTVGKIDFNTMDLYMGSASIKDMKNTAQAFFDGTNIISVPTSTLDVLANGKSIDLIKIDCEGAEPSIIRGGYQTLKSGNAQIFLEYAPLFYSDGEAVEMLNAFESYQYSFYKVTHNSTFEKVSREHLLNQTEWSELYLKKK